MPSWLERLRDALAPGIAVEREIASGGMGHVALGRDTVLDRLVAIKVLQPEKASAINAERFLREARRAASLKHPNIVQVHRAEEAGGLFFYTMDFVDGETLAQRLARGPLAPEQVVRLGVDLLEALGAAHARGIIHRDVKPSNIFLSGERALLGDFGIAYALDSGDTELTRTGEVVGTPAYLAPEQLEEGLTITPLTDLYAAGLVLFEAATGRRWRPRADPDRGDWTRVPEPLRASLRRALRVEPAERWPASSEFRAALLAAGTALAGKRAGRVRVPLFAKALMAAAVVAAMPFIVDAWRSDSRPRRDLVIFPFGTAGLADSSLGPRLAGLTGWSFERLTDLRLSPLQVALRQWRASNAPPGRRLEELTRMTGSRHGTWGIVRRRGPLLEVQLRVVGEDGRALFESTVVGDSADLPALGDSVAFTITRALFASRRMGRADALARRSLAAQTEFLLGEDAFARDAWLTAERHYLRAFELDSSFLLAGWRLGNARRWMPLRAGPPYPPGLLRLYESHRDALAAVDRYLIEAQFRPSGAPRFERYEQALKAAADDPYAALLYGDELFHRGPLAGRPPEEAVRMLERAVVLDPTLAPAWEHLAWALIRLGERARSETALAHLERLAGRPEESEIYLPMFLRMAHDIRFDYAGRGLNAARGLVRSPAALGLAARGALSFDLAAAEAALGSALAQSGGTPDQRASGLTASGLALVALGRPNQALAAFDSAAATFSSPTEAGLQALEWRVVPAALGMPGLEEGERERGRAGLLALARGSARPPRAAWALALDAFTRGDTAAARAWTAQVRSAGAAGERLIPLLDGLDHASERRWDAALAASEPALAWDSSGYAPDPFLRSALHLLRGEWLTRLDRLDDADRAWLWYENVDVRGWPDAEAQPAEVDWALATHARVLRARLALARGRHAAGCALARRAAEIWSNAEPGLEEARRELAGLEARCPT